MTYHVGTPVPTPTSIIAFYMNFTFLLTSNPHIYIHPYIHPDSVTKWSFQHSWRSKTKQNKTNHLLACTPNKHIFHINWKLAVSHDEYAYSIFIFPTLAEYFCRKLKKKKKNVCQHNINCWAYSCYWNSLRWVGHAIVLITYSTLLSLPQALWGFLSWHTICNERKNVVAKRLHSRTLNN